LTTATADKSVHRMAVETEATMFKEPIMSPIEVSTLRGRRRLKKRLRDKIRLLLTYYLVPTTVDYDVLPLPEQLSQFYYVLRPVRVVTRPVRLLVLHGPLLVKSLYGTSPNRK